MGCPLRIIFLVEGHGRGDAAPSERPRMIIWLLHVTASYTTEGVSFPSPLIEISFVVGLISIGERELIFRMVGPR